MVGTDSDGVRGSGLRRALASRSRRSFPGVLVGFATTLKHTFKILLGEAMVVTEQVQPWLRGRAASMR